jgi:hypothetical protein
VAFVGSIYKAQAFSVEFLSEILKRRCKLGVGGRCDIKWTLKKLDMVAWNAVI